MKASTLMVKPSLNWPSEATFSTCWPFSSAEVVMLQLPLLSAWVRPTSRPLAYS